MAAILHDNYHGAFKKFLTEKKIIDYFLSWSCNFYESTCQVLISIELNISYQEAKVWLLYLFFLHYYC